MKHARHYRLIAGDPHREILLTATGAMGSQGTEVYVDDSGVVRAEVDGHGDVRTVTSTLFLGRPLRIEPVA
ncbi:DUF6296 family protein [Kitasatospora sp. NPDC101176]|uniref:DUF6296 family protein n=1 Tax=Kitasatospora sp. NPDC101176 TaxID=3364099 RepID=UPI003801BACD